MIEKIVRWWSRRAAAKQQALYLRGRAFVAEQIAEGQDIESIQSKIAVFDFNDFDRGMLDEINEYPRKCALTTLPSR